MKKKQNTKPKRFSFQDNWEETVKIQASLGKILRNSDTINLTQDQIQIILNSVRTLLKLVDTFKQQQKHYKNIQQSYSLIQAKLSNHDNIVTTLQKNYTQRIKSIMEQSKSIKQQMDKLKKATTEIQQQCKISNNQLKHQNIQLEDRIKFLEYQRQRFKQQFNQQQQQIIKLKQLLQKIKNSSICEIECQPEFDPRLQNIFCSSLASSILNYLNPIDINNCFMLNKQIRLFMMKSKSCFNALRRSCIQIKDRKIRYYHRHIEYFQKLSHKIPQQIIQTTFYQYHIAKQSIGPQILSILNSSALIFQGKFMDVDLEYTQDSLNSPFTKLINEANKNYLDVEKSIIEQYLEQKKTSRDKSLKEIDLMYKKIQTTAQLYSADVQSIGLFLKNVLKNFSKVFVLSKNLYAQARNLQCLNQFLLNQLIHWDKSNIHYISAIQDLKAQLEAQKKLKLFFTQKSQKSQQKALTEQNQKLNIQMKYNQVLKTLDQLYHQKKQFQFKFEEIQKNCKQINQENKDLKKAYENGKDKYHKIIQELSVVKQTIIRMNLV